MSKQHPGTALITGASTGIGAVYARRFGARGHDLVLVARNQTQLSALAQQIRNDHGVQVEVMPADLTVDADLHRIEAHLRENAAINLLVNNAGLAAKGTFANQDVDAVEALIRLNVRSLARLTAAILPRFLAANSGAIINLSSVVALAPEFPLGMYGGTKAFVLGMSQALQVELAHTEIYIQAVLPAATRTEIWERAGRSVEKLPAVMGVEELVDAALVGYDAREPVTLPSLPDVSQWEAFESARKKMVPNFNQHHAAARYTK